MLKLKMWSVIAKAACEFYSICPPWKEYKKARYLLGVHMLPRVDPIMVSRAVAHSRTKKTHESHIHICRCVPQLLRLSMEVLKTPHSKAVTKPRD